MDGIDYPICTEGEYSCLWYHVQERGSSPTDVRQLALMKILRNHRLTRTEEVVRKCVEYLYGTTASDPCTHEGAPEHPERRTANDGIDYTIDEFLEHYGPTNYLWKWLQARYVSGPV